MLVIHRLLSVSINKWYTWRQNCEAFVDCTIGNLKEDTKQTQKHIMVAVENKLKMTSETDSKSTPLSRWHCFYKRALIKSSQAFDNLL